MKKKFEVSGIFRGVKTNPEVVEVEVSNPNDSEEVKKKLKEKACLDEVTTYTEV